MDRREFVSALSGAVILRDMPRQAKPSGGIDLARLADTNGLKSGNRSASRLSEGSRTGARLTPGNGEAVAFVPGTDLTTGVITCELRGKDVAQQSFLGVAFHGADETTYDAIYFRPFNFRAENPVNRSHAVQYHSLPTYGWQKLRTEQPGKYEKGVEPPPDPNGWFLARVVVAGNDVSVFVGDAKEPCLKVALLGTRKRGLVGIWVGNNSGGDFANLTIAPA
jgi:hypothetical protein